MKKAFVFLAADSVSKGYSYRMKTTHYALDSKGKVVESFTMYSNTKSY